jgi:eukaryotic-like serine/threonine-protein kinase
MAAPQAGDIAKCLARLCTHLPMTASLPIGPSAGDHVASFELIERIGAGGYGSVWRAKHRSLEHHVAIKFLSPAASESAQARFRREARLVSRIGSATRHITHIIDHGLLANATPYLVMELLEGETLEALLARQGSVPLATVTSMTVQLCHALIAVHAGGVVHRDVNPANIFFCNDVDGSGVFVKLLDFGLAKAPPRAGSFTTEADTVLGTMGYISPEQMSGGLIDWRSDLWSLTAVVYRALLGRRPFLATQVAAAEELGSSGFLLPSVLRNELPKGLDDWMKKGLAANVEARFQNASELATELERVVGRSLVPEPKERSRLTLAPARSLMVAVGLLAIGLLGAAYWIGAHWN